MQRCVSKGALETADDVAVAGALFNIVSFGNTAQNESEPIERRILKQSGEGV